MGDTMDESNRWKGGARVSVPAREAVVCHQVDVMEARLFAMVADQQVQHTADLREIDKLVDLSNKNGESRMDTIEQRLTQHEFRLSAVIESLENFGLISLDGSSGRREAAPARAQVRSEGPLPETPLCVPVEASETSTDKGRSSRKRTGSADAVLLAVQELESVMRIELRTIHKRCNTLQDLIEQQALASLTDIQQRLQEQGSTVKQLISVGQDCSSRVEEHEFRLGVARTKMDVHDEKISRLEARRWSQCLGGGGGTDRGGVAPTSPVASPHSDILGKAVGFGMPAKPDKWQMTFQDSLSMGSWAN